MELGAPSLADGPPCFCVTQSFDGCLANCTPRYRRLLLKESLMFAEEEGTVGGWVGWACDCWRAYVSAGGWVVGTGVCLSKI